MYFKKVRFGKCYMNTKDAGAFKLFYSDLFIFIFSANVDIICISYFYFQCKGCTHITIILLFVFIFSWYSTKKNTEKDVNLNGSEQPDWTLIATICVYLIVVVIVIILYIRKKSKIYRFTTKLLNKMLTLGTCAYLNERL